MDRVRHDAQRTNALQLQGYVVLRFWNNEVLANLAGVVETIDRALAQRLPPPQPSPPELIFTHIPREHKVMASPGGWDAGWLRIQ
jgi:hypothetical protein